MSEELEPIEGQEAPAAEPSAEDVAARQALRDEAKKYGWRPKEDYTNPPVTWVDEERFLELPKTQIKMLRDQKAEVEKQLKERDDRFSRIEGTTQQAIEAMRRQEQERFQGQLQALKAAQRQAAEQGDVQRFDQLSEMEGKLRPPQVQNQPDPEMRAFVASTPWGKDPYLFQQAAMLIDANPQVQTRPPVEQAKWADEQLRRYYPHMFAAPEPPPTPGPSRVDGGGLAFGRRGKGASDLPADVRKEGEGFVKMGLFKSLDDYAAKYWEQG